MSVVQTATANNSNESPYDVQSTEAEAGRKGNMISPKRHGQDVSLPPRSPELPRAASYTYMSDTDYHTYSNAPSVKGDSDSDVFVRQDDDVDLTPTDSSGLNTPEESLSDLELRAPRAHAIIARLQKNGETRPHALSDATEDSNSSAASSVKCDDKGSLESSRTTSTSATTAPNTPKPRSSFASNFSRKLNRRSWVSSSNPATPSRSPSPVKEEKAVQSEQVTSAPAHDADKSTPHSFMARRKSFPKRLDSLTPSAKKKGGKDASDGDGQKEKQPAKRKGEKDVSQIDEQKQKQPARRPTLLPRISTSGRPRPGLFKKSTTNDNENDKPVANGIPRASEDAKPDQPPAGRPSMDGNGTPTKAKSKAPPMPALPKLPKSFSTDRLPSLRSDPQTPSQKPTVPVPRLLSSDRTTTPLKKKDELWSVFRTLDADFAKFSSKSLALKANVVRSTLLPFLRTYASHPSNVTLRAEDLDRRSNILNKWWTGLIEMLHGRNNQSISGTDRPIILDGISGLMERPEWRLPPSPFCPLNQRMTAGSSSSSSSQTRSKTSVTSDASDFLTESVHHNVRNIFIQNLSSQMAFVVDKMSLRNASASLVTFCGKACAYGFVFVPGMADILVRLWDLRMDPIRRVLAGNGIGKFENLTTLSDEIVSGFPPALHQLGFSSLMKFMRKLRTPPPLPVGTANIEWWGHWLDRWSGRESDLFYVFVKHFHILATDFLPSDSSKQERMCAPGLLLVHSQILTNLDATIHRNTNQSQQDPSAASPSPTFDDVLADADAVAPALPVSPTNAVRLMAENRSIMLIRDFLSERAAQYPAARHMFAESFNDLLQTVATGTSMFDHAACYTLLDFLDEALPLLARFEGLEGFQGKSLIDLDFWTLVWKKMIESQNTMTEIRLYAFIYTVWNSVICELGWKADLCDNLLLDAKIFESRFNHWCPMVRAYFMRLLCWRVGRFDGEATPDDMKIYETLLERLQESWSSYRYLREQAVKNDTLAPPTNPCMPAPSRRLLIIRTDPQVGSPASFLSFDGLLSSRSPSEKRNSTISHVIEVDTMRPESSLSCTSDFDPEPRGRSIGGFLKNLIPSTAKSRAKSRDPSRTASPSSSSKSTDPPAGVGIQRSATDDPTTPSSTPDKASSSSPATPPPRPYTFKFSLEYQPNSKPLPPMRLQPPRLPLPAHQHLQQQSPFPLTLNAAPVEPRGPSVAHARYCGRALAEWTVVLGECQSFFERRRHEGVQGLKGVETPGLGVEVFRRPG